MSSSGGGDGEAAGTDVPPPPQARNPLLCFLCDDYYADPCLLSCFHTFCSRCLRGREHDGKIACPLCCQTTSLKEGATLPPTDLLMRQLIDWANAENPPCANCDKRNKSSMYFCSTCGQALCEHCRENTHKAKMFSTHDVVHMSKCAREGHRRWIKAYEQLLMQRAPPGPPPMKSSLESQLQPRCVRSVKHCLKRACRVFLLCQQCALHGEQYIMFSNSQKNMLCVNCFRDTPQEARLHCVDIDTAYTQGCKKLDRAVLSVCDLQSSVREGAMLFKTLLEELRRNMESEKHTINSFCQGLQEAIAKTHSSMIMEIQRQFETKERQFRGQLVSLGTMLPILQLHLLLCSTFSTSANKYQFLELAYPMMDRLAAVSQLSHPLRPVQSSQIRTNYRNEFAHSLEPWVGKGVTGGAQVSSLGDMVHALEGGQFDGQSGGAGQQQVHPHAATTRRQHSALRAKALEGEGPFSNHCRSFDSQIKELSEQLVHVKESLGELHRDVTVLRRAHTRPLSTRYELVTRECHSLEQQLEQQQVELDRLKAVFDTLWEEQLCRIHVEQEIFTSQMNDIVTLRTEVKHLSTVAHQLEPYVKSLVASEQTSQTVSTEPQDAPPSHQQLQSLLEHISLLQHDAGNYRVDTQKSECKVHPTQSVMSPTAENIMYMKVDGKDVPIREVPRCRTPSSREQLEAASAAGVLYPTSRSAHRQPAREPTQDGKRGVLSQLIDKVDCRQVRSKEDRKKSPVQEDVTVRVRERAKSDGRVNVEGTRPKTPSSADDLKHTSTKCPQYKAAKEGAGSGITRHSSVPSQQQQAAAAVAKVASLYHTLSGSGSGGGGKRDEHGGTHHRRSHSQSMQEVSAAEIAEVRERLETHLKEKLHDMLTRPSRISKEDEADYQRLADANEGQRSPGGPTQQAVRALVHREPNTAASTPSSPRRKSSGRLYPSSDTDEPGPLESSKRRQASCESLSLSTLSVASPRHSIDLADRKTLVVVIGTTSKGKSRLMQKQRSWETFPPKKRGFDERGGGSAGSSGSRDSAKFCKDSDSFHGGFSSKSLHLRHSSGDGTLKKADSFEGHEEAVRTLVAAVQETRSQQLQQQQQQQRKSKSGN